MNNYKKVEKMLYEYNMLKISIENMEEEIKFIEEDIGVGGIDYESPSSNTNKISSTTESTVLGRMEKIEYLEQQIEKHARQIEKINRTIKGLTETQKQVIVERYINGKQWYEVAGVVFRGERQCRTIRTEAINKMIVGIYGR